MSFGKWWKLGGGGQAGRDACARAWKAALLEAADRWDGDGDLPGDCSPLGITTMLRAMAAQQDVKAEPALPQSRTLDSTLPHDFICADCADELGGRWPEGRTMTWYDALFRGDPCKYCGKQKPLCSVGDYNWPDGKARGMRD